MKQPLKSILKKRFAQFIALTLFSSAVCLPVTSQADEVLPTFNIRQLTKDTDIVSENARYVFAINGWQSNPGTTYTVNGVDFLTVKNGNLTYNQTPVVYLPQLGTTIGSHAGGTVNGLESGQQLDNILKGMIYTESQFTNNRVDLISNGLTPGKTYTLSLLSRVWTETDARKHTLSFDSNLDGQPDQFALSTASTTPVSSFTLSEDAPATYWSGIDKSKPYMVEYTFVAQSNALRMTDLALKDNNSWHLYGASLYEHSDVPAVAMAPMVSNGSFEADVYVETGASDSAHGYASNHNSFITSWNITKPELVGLAPSWTSSEQTAAKCKDFFNTDKLTVPDGKQVLYLQSNNGDGAISQNIDNLAAGEEYVLSYYAGYRYHSASDIRLPKYTVTMGNATKTDVLTANMFAPTQFVYKEFKFTADSTSEKLGFAINSFSDANASVDRSLLLDNVQIVKASEYTAPTIASTTNGWAALRWNSDETSRICEKTGAYSHAYNIGKNENVTVNGITFTGAARAKTGTSFQSETGNMSFISNGNNANEGFTDDIVSGASETLAKETSYNLQNIVLNGLEPGATYETTVYLRSYGAQSLRTGTLTVNGNESPTIEVDKFASVNGGGLLVQVSGKADDQGVIYIGVKNNNSGNTLHVSGVSNQFVSDPTAGYNDNIVLKSQFTGTADENLTGKAPETLADSLAGKTWIRRGQINSDNIPTVSNNVLKSGYNTGVAIDVQDIMTTADKICLSADLKVGSVGGTGTGAYSSTRGVGLGFFDSNLGSNFGEVGRGFSGLVYMPDGTLLYYENGKSGNILSPTTEALAWSGVSFSSDAWVNLAIDMEVFSNGEKARITGISLDGSSIDFANSSLIGKVFNTTDLAGLTSSSNAVNTYTYADNFQLRVLSTTNQWEKYKEELNVDSGGRLLGVETFTETSGTPVPGTRLDISENLGTQNAWGLRGSATDIEQKWNADGSKTGAYPVFTVIGNEVKTSANSGIAIDYDSDNKYGMTISLDLMLGTLTGTEKNQARGIGLGFFDDTIGTTSGEVGRGFSGLIVGPDGGIYFYDNQTDNVTNVQTSDTVAYKGASAFSKDDWHTLTMDVEFLGDSAQLMGLSFSGSDADYSSLLGSVFNTTDLLGILSSSANSWSFYGYVDNFRADLKVPEPTTVSLILIGLAGLFFFRTRNHNQREA